MGISVAAMLLSLLVPVLLSVFFYGEGINGPKVLGIILVFGALLLLVPRQNNIRIGNIDASWLLLIIFFLTGFADASLKVYNEEFSLAFSESIFMGWNFLSAFLIGLGLAIFREGSLATREEVKMGMLIGIPNLYSAIFLIYALEGISGAVAFPIVNTLNVLGGTILGLWYWGDLVSRKQWGGIVVAIIAILLLV
jgi:drug/metabolite transporter (DMT)-like permease